MTSPKPDPYVWDFFIAHAGPDKEPAEELYNLLEGHARVFLDSRCLKLGDEWGEALPKAQRESLISVVLLSSNTERAYYQREEIAAAIDLSRASENAHRVVPVYFDADLAENKSVPYGLRGKHGLIISDELKLKEVAVRLLGLLKQLQDGDDKVPVPMPVVKEPVVEEPVVEEPFIKKYALLLSGSALALLLMVFFLYMANRPGPPPPPPINNPPTAVDDSRETTLNKAITIDVLGNDSDVDGDTISLFIVGNPDYGSTVENPDGTVHYTPADRRTGDDTFTYTIKDTGGSTASATVTITVEVPGRQVRVLITNELNASNYMASSPLFNMLSLPDRKEKVWGGVQIEIMLPRAENTEYVMEWVYKDTENISFPLYQFRESQIRNAKNYEDGGKHFTVFYKDKEIFTVNKGTYQFIVYEEKTNAERRIVASVSLGVQ